MSATWRVAICVLVPTGSGCRSDLLKGLDEMADPRGDIRVDVGELYSVPGRSGHAHHAPVGVDGRRLLAQEYVRDGTVEPVIERLFADREVDYIHVRDTEAGCFDFALERSR